MKKFLVIMAAAVMLVTSGCIESTNIVHLKADGSGQITSTTYMSAAALGMMSGMGGGEGASGNPMMDKAKAAAKAAEMGEGVEFVSIKEVAKKDGSKGAKAVYSFKDITKIKVAMNDSDAGEKPGGGEKKAEKAFVTFGYTRGNLTINIPRDKDETSAEKPPSPPEQDPMAKQMMAGMMPMMKGMRIRSLIAFPSEIKSTNASHVGVNTKTKKKQYITLMDFNMDKMLAQPDGMDKLAAMQNGGSEAEMMEMIKNIPGIKVEMRENVTVKF